MTYLFFEYVHNLGGAQIANVNFIENLKKNTAHKIDVLDVFGTCEKFNDFVSEKNIVKQSVISGEITSVKGAGIFALIRLHILIVRNLIKFLKQHEYKSIWTSSEKGLYTLILARFFGNLKFKLIFYAHGYDRLFKLKSLFYFLCRRNVIAEIWVLSSHFKDLYLQRKVPENKICIIPNAIDVTAITKVAGLPTLAVDGNFNNDKIKILLPASVVRAKGVMEALAAQDLMVKSGRTDIILYLAGATVDNNLHQEIINFIKAANLEKYVVILGWRKDIARLMSMSDIIILPSYSEGMPLVLLEAMALKKPVIATRVGAIPDMITDGYNGFMIAPKEVAPLVEKISLILKDDNRIKFGINALESVKQKFSKEEQVSAFKRTCKQF